MILIIILVTIFLAINMGASGFSISFAPSYGSNIINRKYAALFFTIFITCGAFFVGPRVVETLTIKLAGQYKNQISGFIILVSASFTMFAANILKIPQSTSFVTVGAFFGSGMFFGQANWTKLAEIFSIAVIFSAAAYLLTYLLIKLFYPPKQNLFGFYEKFAANQNIIRKFILLTNCYSAFAVGTNNVANVVAPLKVAGFNLSSIFLLLIFAPLFGLGGLIFGKSVIKTISRDIVPMGEISAAVVSLVTSSFVITASLLGLPTPYVQFTTFSVLAISAIKNSFTQTASNKLVQKIIMVWILVPIFTAVLSYLFHKFLIKI